MLLRDLPFLNPAAGPDRSSRAARAARRSSAAAILVAATVLIAACAQPSPDEPPAESSAAPSVDLPETPVGAQARWVLDEVNAEEAPRESDLEERFDPVMFEQLAAADLQKVFTDMQAAAPWTAIAYEGTELQARVTIESAQATYDMTLSVTDEEKVNGLYFGPPQAERTPAASWEELREQIEEAPFTATLQVSDASEGGAGETLELIGDPVASPIGSVFKLWVLGAVVDAVAAETLTWDTELTIDAGVRSLPSGEMQNLPDGTAVTVREAAEKMIAISDNTATDALIRAVGRDAVVAAMTDMGHAQPESNTPFLTTREMFWLLFGDPGLREMWAGAADDSAARAALLERIPAGVPDLAAAAAATPGWSAGIDWFATPDDIVAAHVALQERARTDAGEPVRGILSANPGIEFGDEWTYAGFKGGSSLGVLAGSWLLEREGADPVVITVFARSDDAQQLANPGIVFGWAEDAAALIAAG